MNDPTTVFDQWADAHGIPAAARRDYYARLSTPFPYVPADPEEERSESAVSSLLRLEAARLGWPLWRNNVGAAKTETGSFIRFGLANDSAALNKVLKSSDLIGIKPVVVRPEHVGTKIGQFVAREVKHSAWRFTGTDREKAQLRFIELVRGMGGDASFSTGPTNGR